MTILRSQTLLQDTQAKVQTKPCKRVCLPNRTDIAKIDRQATTEKEGRTHNSTYPKVATQWLNQTFYSIKVCAWFTVKCTEIPHCIKPQTL